jgi:hypothetical protein
VLEGDQPGISAELKEELKAWYYISQFTGTLQFWREVGSGGEL